uniref:E3 ubiquitin-protein ligase RNF181 isoform X1 n=1 Tax=Odobenus rosmarus divergens TaxID=9708 RepID=UPI00063C5462|nr:PREDICTED: E3 ubiquitin-protein ligase RNF181 isoform X1 [Odobenus rosmarus divergens]
MASYFDEHDCEPLDSEQEARTNMLLELARSLFNRMDFEDLGLVVDWDHHLPPPAAKAVVENLPRTVIRGSQAELKCPVCLLEFEEEETAIEMPCHHLFHSNCILPWLSKTNSCPLCRHELPTDDDTYEEHRRDKVGAGGKWRGWVVMGTPQSLSSVFSFPTLAALGRPQGCWLWSSSW